MLFTFSSTASPKPRTRLLDGVDWFSFSGCFEQPATLFAVDHTHHCNITPYRLPSGWRGGQTCDLVPVGHCSLRVSSGGHIPPGFTAVAFADLAFHGTGPTTHCRRCQFRLVGRTRSFGGALPASGGHLRWWDRTHATVGTALPPGRLLDGDTLGSRRLRRAGSGWWFRHHRPGQF